MIKAALYIRVSTEDQAKEGYSIGEQRERLIAYCKAKNYAIHEIYTDGGYSGSNLDRPGIQKLKEDIGKFNLVLVYKLDRLSRSQFDILNLIEKTFLPNGIDFVSMSEAFDTSTPFGRAMIGILGVFAQLEREQIRERSIMGRKARAKEGRYHGGGSHAVGYEYVDGKLIINEYEAEQIRLLFQMAAENKSNLAIIKAMNDAGYTTKYGGWNHSSRITRTLKKDIYTGTLRFEDIVIENAHEPIISKELFEEVQKIRTQRRDLYGKNSYNRTMLLSGFVWCAKCGSRFGCTISQTKSKKTNEVTSRHRYYTCYARSMPWVKMAKTEKCNNKWWREDRLETFVNKEINNLIFEKGYFEKLSGKKQKKEAPTKAGTLKKINEIEKQISKLMLLYASEAIPFDELTGTIDKLHKEKSTLSASINNNTKNNPQINVDEFKIIIENMKDLWEIAEFDQKRLLLASLIRKIIIDDDIITINWMFEDIKE